MSDGMPASSNFSPVVLSQFKNRRCKVVYRDGGTNSPAKAFYGMLRDFDCKFQVWEGNNDPNKTPELLVAFNHDDVNRIVMELKGDVIA